MDAGKHIYELAKGLGHEIFENGELTEESREGDADAAYAEVSEAGFTALFLKACMLHLTIRYNGESALSDDALRKAHSERTRGLIRAQFRVHGMEEVFDVIEEKAFRTFQLCRESQEEGTKFSKQYREITDEVSAAEDARDAAEAAAEAPPDEGEVENTPSSQNV